MTFSASTSIIMAGGAAHPAFYQDARFYILISLALFFGLLLWKGVHKAIAKSLDERAETISNDLDEARRLREEAQTLLASYHRKQSEAEKLAEDIVAQARKDAATMAADARAQLAEKLERRTQVAEEKIAAAEAQAMNDVKARAAQLAVEAAETILRKDLRASDHSRLISEGLKQMGNALN